jgi:hypothetical protein
MKLHELHINAGECPTCHQETHFTPTFKKHVYRCEICLNKVKQQINGKIIYKEIPIPEIFIP